MSPRTIGELVVEEPPTVRADQSLGDAIRTLLDSNLPALPVVGAEGSYAGIFGEREFLGAVFPRLPRRPHARRLPLALDLRSA
jgi:CBS domain-containing protein